MRRLLGTVNDVIRVLPTGTRRFVLTYSLISAGLSLLDVAALGLLALAMPQLLAGDRSIELPLVGQLEGPAAVSWLLAVIGGLFVVKSLAALLVTYWGVRRFAAHEIALAERLYTGYLHAPWAYRLRASTSRIVRNMDVGLSLTFNGLLMPYASLVAEAASFLAIASVILVAEPLTALTATVYFAVVALLLYRVIARKNARNGAVAAATSARTVQLVQETVAAMKELTLRGTQDDLAEVVGDVRSRSARARCSSFFFGVAPRYVLEAALIGGFLVVGAVAWLASDVSGAVTAVALFAAAGFRVVPSLTRFQAVLATMHANEQYAREIIEDVEELDLLTEAAAAERRGSKAPVPARGGDIELSDVTFRYPDAKDDALSRVSLRIPAGSRFAVVGRSGSGKSTLVDVMLGLLVPQSGSVHVGEVPLASVLSEWRRRVGYVPQQVALFDASVAENVALTWRRDAVDDARVREALEGAQLWDVVVGLPDGIESSVGEGGLRLSGGQRQRLGIARALYARPSVLVLDEATSALDTSTEAAVTETIRRLPTDVTVIVIAHRLATIRDADGVVLLEDGAIRAVGTFDELVSQVPDFATQAALAGLAEHRG